MADFNSNRFQSKRQTYETPQDLFAPLANEFRFTLDVAADATNAKCAEFFDEAANGLAQDWRGVCWCNPPYREQSKWVKKAFAEARAGRATTVLLVPARTNTGWWHDYCMKGEVRFIRGRPRFAGCKHGLPQPLALVIFRTSNRSGESPAPQGRVVLDPLDVPRLRGASRRRLARPDVADAQRRQHQVIEPFPAISPFGGDSGRKRLTWQAKKDVLSH